MLRQTCVGSKNECLSTRSDLPKSKSAGVTAMTVASYADSKSEAFGYTSAKI
jgi:hypothetical protein